MTSPSTSEQLVQLFKYQLILTTGCLTIVSLSQNTTKTPQETKHPPQAMYGHSHQSLVSYTSADLIGNLPLLDATALPPPLLFPPSYEFDPMGAVALPKLELSYSCSSGCSSYESPSSLTSYSVPSPSLMQRSISSLSLQKNDGVNGFRQFVSTTSLGDFVDTETSHVRRVFSAGDLQVSPISYAG